MHKLSYRTIMMGIFDVTVNWVLIVTLLLFHIVSDLLQFTFHCKLWVQNLTVTANDIMS